MQNRHFFPILVTLLVGCGGSSAATKSNGVATSDSSMASDGSPTSGKARASKGKSLKFDDVSPVQVTALQFLHSRLAVGFADGGIAFLDSSNAQVSNAKVAKVHSVAAIAPDGALALLAASPPVIVNVKGDLILQMNTVPSFESAVFGTDGVTLYVADKAGKVRIWGQAHSFEEDQHKEKLEDYLNRQAPDFHVEFAPIRGPIHMTGSNKLVVVDQEGNVRLWDPTRPSGTKRIMKVGGGARSIASADGYVFVTSVTGALKVGVEDGSGYMPWSKDARAAYVAASGMSAGTFYTLDSGQLQARSTQSGEAEWTATLPDGRPCGLAVSGDGNTLAACVGHFVATFDAKDGSPIAYGYRADGEFQWKQ